MGHFRTSLSRKFLCLILLQFVCSLRLFTPHVVVSTAKVPKMYLFRYLPLYASEITLSVLALGEKIEVKHHVMFEPPGSDVIPAVPYRNSSIRISLDDRKLLLTMSGFVRDQLSGKFQYRVAMATAEFDHKNGVVPPSKLDWINAKPEQPRMKAAEEFRISCSHHGPGCEPYTSCLLPGGQVVTGSDVGELLVWDHQLKNVCGSYKR